MSFFKKAALVAALSTASLSANAAEAHITVWAQVDTSLALMKSDGSELPDIIKLAHSPASGLSGWSEQVRIYTNDVTKDVEVRLINAPSLIATDAASAAPAVPLKVALNRRELTLTNTDFLAADLYGTDGDAGIPGGSVAMPLTIEQATKAPITVAGKYEGMVSIALAQKTKTP